MNSKEIVIVNKKYAESFWKMYLSGEVWTKLNARTQDHLINAKILNELYYTHNILKNRKLEVVALSQAIEKEMNVTLFTPFILIFKNAKFSDECKNIEFKKKAFDSFHYAALKEKLPTFGSLSVLIDLLINEQSADCTDVYITIRKMLELNNERMTFLKNIKELLNSKCQSNAESFNIIEMRNNASHANADDFNWEAYADYITEAMGGEKELLKNIVSLRI